MKVNKQEIIEFAKSIGAYSCGIAPLYRFDELLPLLEKRGFVPFVRGDLEQRINPFINFKNGKCAIVCLFEYIGGNETDIAKYARGADYHIYVKDKLKQICEFIGTENKYKILVDTGTLCDKYLAYLAGLGFYGLNNLLYADGIGSRFYIGSILTDLDLKTDKPLNKTCLKCGKCIEKCVGQALSQNYFFDVNKCASYLTQKNSDLSEHEQEIIKKCGYTLGCDVCSDVCPLNGGK